MSSVEEARRNFEESLGELKGSLERQSGLSGFSGGAGRPRRGWVVGAVALAAGVALGMSLRRRFRRRGGRP